MTINQLDDPSEMTEKQQFRSQAIDFASSSSGSKPVAMKEKVGYNKETFRLVLETTTNTNWNFRSKQDSSCSWKNQVIRGNHQYKNDTMFTYPQLSS